MLAKGEARFKAADKDNDGTLDKEEAKSLPKVSKNFDAIDTDKDGTVSLEEIAAFMKSKKQDKKK
jgi:Ca2+-binding EF-hand superfamily protein